MKTKRKRLILFLAAVTFFLIGVFVLYNLNVKASNAALVKYSDMELVDVGIYVEPNLPDYTKNLLLLNINRSIDKVAVVFGERQSSPVLIYVEEEKGIKKYASTSKGLTYYFPWNNYIVIRPEGLNEYVIAHEYTHAELRERLHNKDKVPIWFDEGLAAMIDGGYTENAEVWKSITNNGADPVNYDLLASRESFFSSNKREHLNLACYEVSRWYSIVGQPGLIRLINALNDGKKFKEQYKMIESNERTKSSG